MFPPQPHVSLPTAKYGIFHGLSRPLRRRRFARSESALDVIYSIHSITPVILVGETATGPAQDRNMQFFQRSNDVITQAARVRDRRVFPHPKAVVDQTAEVFGKLAVDVTVDGPSWLVQPDRERGFI